MVHVQWETFEGENFRGENFHDCLLTPAMLKDTTSPNFVEKTFANSHKSAKFVEGFFLESFPLYYCKYIWIVVHMDGQSKLRVSFHFWSCLLVSTALNQLSVSLAEPALPDCSLIVRYISTVVIIHWVQSTNMWKTALIYRTQRKRFLTRSNWRWTVSNIIIFGHNFHKLEQVWYI